MNIGFSTGFLRPDSMETMVNVCRESKISRVELWEHDGFFAESVDPLVIRQRFDEEGIIVNSVHAPFPDGALLPPSNRELYLLSFEKACSKGKTYGASYVVFHPAVIEGEGYTGTEELHSLEQTLLLWKEVVKIAGRYGLKTAFENLPRCRAWPEGLTPVQISGLLKSGGVENSGICLDISHVFALNISDQIYEILPTLSLLGVHVSDGIKDNCKDRHLPPGEGDFDWERFMGITSGRHASISLIIEVNSPYLDGKLLGKVSRFLSGKR
ncbi:MAG: sugar phosphate isomerase/epimerase family protein [Aminobacteriaceae bacterium]